MLLMVLVFLSSARGPSGLMVRVSDKYSHGPGVGWSLQKLVVTMVADKQKRGSPRASCAVHLQPQYTDNPQNICPNALQICSK